MKYHNIIEGSEVQEIDQLNLAYFLVTFRGNKWMVELVMVIAQEGWVSLAGSA